MKHNQLANSFWFKFRYSREILAGLIFLSFLLISIAVAKLSYEREYTLLEKSWRENLQSNLEIFSNAAESEMKAHEMKVARIVSLMESSQKWEAQKSLNDYLAVGLLKNQSKELKWRLDSKESEKSLADKKSTDELGQALLQVKKSMDLNRVNFLAYSNSNGEARSALMIPLKVKDQASGADINYQALVVTKTAFFQKLVENKRDALENYILVNEEGTTVGHSISEYVGRPISDSSLWHQINKENLNSGVVTTDITGASIMAAYKEVNSGTMRAIVQTKSGLNFSYDWIYYGRWILGLIFLGSVLASFSYMISVKPHVEIKEVIVEKPKSTGGFTLSDALPLPVAKESLLGGFVPQTKTILVAPEVPKVIANLVTKIKTPTLSILGQVHLSKAGHGIFNTDSIEREAREIKECLDAMNYYVEQSGEPQFSVRIADIVDGALKMLEMAIRQNGVRVSKEIPSDLAVLSQPEDLKIAFYEIFKNAVEAMEKSSTRHLVIEAKSIADKVTLRIRDTGCGIAPDSQRHLFEPFYTNKSKLDHSGLGLSVAKGIISRHLGTVKVESNQGQGTWIYIEFPVCLEQPKMLGDLRPKTQRDFVFEDDSLEVQEDFSIGTISNSLVSDSDNIKTESKPILPPRRLKPRGEFIGGNS